MGTIREERPRTLKDEIAELRYAIEESKETPQKPVSKQKMWKMPGKWKRTINRSKKDLNKVLVFLLNMKRVMEPPRLVSVSLGDTLIIKNKVYDANPKYLWSLGKRGPKAIIIKEWDRRPISATDYLKVKKTGYCTDSDELLLKATMSAVYSSQNKPVNKAVLVIIGIVVFAAIIMFLSGGGG